MSTLSQFFGGSGGGGGIPIDGVLPLNRSDTLATLADDTVWLRSGYVSTDTATYPDANSVGFFLGTASYDSVSFSVAAQDSNPEGLAFNNDGTKMYVVGDTTNGVYQYSLSTAFDISTASYDSVSFGVTAQDSNPEGLAFNNDGTKMYVLGSRFGSVYQYSLSTAFDISTASYDSVSFSVAAEEPSPRGLAFNNDGTKMYIVGSGSDSVHQYSLSTAFDISTASYDSVSFSVSAEDGGPYSVTFNDNGNKMYIVGVFTDSVYQYSLSTAFDISTASYDGVSFSVAAQDTDPLGLAFNNDGTKMYIVGVFTDSVYQYSLDPVVGFSTAAIDSDTSLPIYVRIA